MKAASSNGFMAHSAEGKISPSNFYFYFYFFMLIWFDSMSNLRPWFDAF